MASDDPDHPSPRRAYRAKLIGADGQTEMTVGIMASDDLEALKQVRGLALTYTVEIWDGERRVTTVMHKR